MKRKENKRNGKLIFCKKKSETPFGNIVFHGKMHICAKYGHFMTNYAMKMAMTTVIWLESHECSYMMSLFVKVFFQNWAKIAGTSIHSKDLDLSTTCVAIA